MPPDWQAGKSNGYAAHAAQGAFLSGTSNVIMGGGTDGFINGAKTGAFKALLGCNKNQNSCGNTTAQEGGESGYDDRVNSYLSSKIHVDSNGVITIDSITISFDGVDDDIARAYAQAIEDGWSMTGIDLQIVSSGGDVRVIPCGKDCSINPRDGGYLGAAQVGGRTMFYGKSQYVDTPVHEFGHIIGLHHPNSAKGSIMGSPPHRRILDDDLNRLRRLYE